MWEADGFCGFHQVIHLFTWIKRVVIREREREHLVKCVDRGLRVQVNHDYALISPSNPSVYLEGCHPIVSCTDR